MKNFRYIATLVLSLTVLLGQSTWAQTRVWSPETKGAVIGAGAGAAAGAIINKKNRTVGGVVGGVVGGAAGYAIGKKTAKKNSGWAPQTVSRKSSRKGWSPQAKGTAIGAGTGAVAGAVINKRNRVVGGVVGGVAGGAAGYAIGKHIDNKRKREEAARIAAAERAAIDAEEKTEYMSRGTGNRTYTYTRPSNGAKAAATGAAGAAGAVAGNALAANPTLSYNAQSNSYDLGALYLPNDTYGDPTAPYGMSEVRRKSW